MFGDVGAVAEEARRWPRIAIFRNDSDGAGDENRPNPTSWVKAEESAVMSVLNRKGNVYIKIQKCRDGSNSSSACAVVVLVVLREKDRDLVLQEESMTKSPSGTDSGRAAAD